MMFKRPIRRKGDRFVVDLGDDESALIGRLTGQLRSLLTDDDPGEDAQALLVRLFPVAYPADDDMEAEYQRLMRDDLVQSKLAALDVVDSALGASEPIDEGRMIAVMQSINSIRLVLGVMLDVSDDPDVDEVDEQREDSPEYALYGYLSLLLEWCVEALSDD
jgi:hypothetical protein